jgi:hypothetical protein
MNPDRSPDKRLRFVVNAAALGLLSAARTPQPSKRWRADCPQAPAPSMSAGEARATLLGTAPPAATPAAPMPAPGGATEPGRRPGVHVKGEQKEICLLAGRSELRSHGGEG